jgi:protein-S-isoprenylcysteine O-methyltransferase Ste14
MVGVGSHARPRLGGWLLAKLVVFVLLVPCTAVGWIPLFVLPRAPAVDLGAVRWSGPVLLLAGVAIVVRCLWEFGAVGEGTPAPIDPPKRLVVSGLYRHVRNPTYVGILLILLGEAVFLGWRSLFFYTAGAAVIFHLFVVLWEERTLRQRFGDAYADYCRAVPRWIPRLGRG